MSDNNNKEQPANKPEENKQGETPEAAGKDDKKKELQKDAEVLKMLEEDEDDFEEFEEGGTGIS